MDAKPMSIGKILGEKQRFIVPIYQRTYAWNQKELAPLVEQIEGKADELLKTGKVAFSHYMGALLLIPESGPAFGRIQAFNVVDGQQRLTTFHLCVAALRDVAIDFGFPEIAMGAIRAASSPTRSRASMRVNPMNALAFRMRSTATTSCTAGFSAGATSTGCTLKPLRRSSVRKSSGWISVSHSGTRR